MQIINSSRPISSVAKNNNINISSKYTSNSVVSKNNYSQKYSPNIYFSGRPINSLYDEYNWYINHDHTSPIDAFLKIDDDQQSMDGFLTAILNTDDRGYQLIDSIVKQPRRSHEFSRKLGEKVGHNSQNLMTFLPNSPYRKAYERYLDNKYENAHTLSELIRIRPDWKGDALIQKYNNLKGNDSLEIGNIPKEFPNNHLFVITDYLSSYMDSGVKIQKNINSIKLDNREYGFKFFTEGKSDKNVFGVFTPEQKKYVIKMGKPDSRSLDAPFALGTLAKIDTYLTTNRSRNSAPLCYYNHDRNMSVYKYIEHNVVENPSKDLRVISDHLPDFVALGLTYNDNVGDKNYFCLQEDSNEDLHNTDDFIKGVENNEWISVDNDHVTYGNKLQPNIAKYNAPLPNAMQMFF